MKNNIADNNPDNPDIPANILAIDTSSNILSAALKTEKGVFSITERESLKHSEKLIPVIQTLTEQAEISVNNINLVICARGPGSFTGLRIGMAAAKGICFALSIPLISVPTLDFLARRHVFFEGFVLPAIDAKKNRFYTAFYKSGRIATDYLDAEIDDITDFAAEYAGGSRILITGYDADKLYNIIKEKKTAVSDNFILDLEYKKCKIKDCMEAGIELFEKSRFDSSNSGPLYIRKSDAEEKIFSESQCLKIEH